MISNSEIILIVENELSVCMTMAEVLESCGFVTFSATSAEEAVKILNSSDDFDLMITDIDLGSSLSGFDLAKSARKMFPELPVIYVTGSNHKTTRLLENSKFLLKPYTSQLLLAEIKILLKKN